MTDAANVAKTLSERERTHGNFAKYSEISLRLCDVMWCASNYRKLTVFQREALAMIQAKIARILEGDPNHADHWHDVAGYAMLAEREMRYEQERLAARATNDRS